MTHPIHLLKQWLDEEKLKGAEYAQHAVLSTQGLDGKPHARVVAIRRREQDIIFHSEKNPQGRRN